MAGQRTKADKDEYTGRKPLPDGNHATAPTLDIHRSRKARVAVRLKFFEGNETRTIANVCQGRASAIAPDAAR
jgi:hypothetical protein